MMSTVVKDWRSQDDQDDRECQTHNNTADVGTGPFIIYKYKKELPFMGRSLAVS